DAILARKTSSRKSGREDVSERAACTLRVRRRAPGQWACESEGEIQHGPPPLPEPSESRFDSESGWHHENSRPRRTGVFCCPISIREAQYAAACVFGHSAHRQL